ncbi:hypothetical protein ASD00_31625 [Ensifer sp. Root31]|nr:hypothetical protein ASD00_31625 [Ensifer sp. Root31]
MLIRWPGTIKPGSVFNDAFSHYDLVPTFAAAGGDPDIVEKCLTVSTRRKHSRAKMPNEFSPQIRC